MEQERNNLHDGMQIKSSQPVIQERENTRADERGAPDVGSMNEAPCPLLQKCRDKGTAKTEAKTCTCEPQCVANKCGCGWRSRCGGKRNTVSASVGGCGELQ